MRSIHLELEQVRNIVCSVDGSLEVTGIAKLLGGSNDVYRLDLAGGAPPLVLKIYDDDPIWAVKKEALVAGWIGDQAGLPIPRWVALDERRILLPSRFALMTWLQGAQVRSLIGSPDIDQAYRQMGALLKRLHRLPMTAYGYIVGDGIGQPKSTNAEYMSSAFDKAFRQFREIEGDPGLMRRLELEVKQRFDVVAHSVGPVFCYNDLQQGNVLAMRDDESGALKLSGLLDFANASAGDQLLDLAQALFCCTHEDPHSREPLLAGYGEIDHPDSGAALRLYTLCHRVVIWSHLKRLNILGVAGDPVGLLQDLNEMCA
jgi:aminoglycoside phosphotransferase (APT) family kinase protein